MPTIYSEHLSPCIHCGADLADPNGGFRTIGIYNVDRDCTEEWMCPDCMGRWPRDYRENPFVTWAKEVRKEAGIEESGGWTAR